MNENTLVGHEVHSHSDLRVDEPAYDNETMQLRAVRLDEQGQVLPTDASPEIEAQIREYYAEVRRQLLEGLHSNLEGLNMERITSYLNSRGLETNSIVLILDDEDYALYEKRHAALIKTPPSDKYGSFTPGADIVAIHRNLKDEEKFGPGITEYRVVHEFTHASARNTSFSYIVTENVGDEPDITILPERSGQISGSANAPGKMVGSYLEEGFSDNVAQDYVHEVLELPGGFGENSPRYITTDEGVLEIPSSVQHDGDGNKENVASLGLGLLFRADSTLFDSFVKGRTDPEGLVEVEDKIKAIGIACNDPRLYDDLQACTPNMTTFCDATMKLVWLLDSDAAIEWQSMGGHDGGQDDEGLEEEGAIRGGETG